MKKIIALFSVYIIKITLLSQANFIAPDTACVNQIINVQNTSIEGNRFSWSHCIPDVGNTPSASLLGNPGGHVNGAPFCDITFDGANYYMFITNYSSNSIVRWDFGSSPLNTPISTNLGNISGVLPNQLEGIQIVKEGTNWLGFTVGNAELIRIDFGNSLINTPTAVSLGNPSNLMSWPHEYQLVKDGNNWYGISANRSNSSIVIHSFGNNLTSTPSASSYTVTSQSNTSNIMAIKENGNWHVFATCLFGPGLIRLDYGNSLTNTPTEVNLGDLNGGISNLPRGMIIVKDCDKYVGFVGHESGDITKLDFQSNLTSQITTTNLGNISSAYQQVASFTPLTYNGNLHLFSPSWGANDVIRMDINMCTGTIPHSDSIVPQNFSYSLPGTYELSLTMNQGKANQSTICKTIEVINNIPFTVMDDTTICENTNLNIDAGNNFTSYLWNNNSTTQIITINQPGLYYVSVQDTNGCYGIDSIIINNKICDRSIRIPNLITPNGDNKNDLFYIDNIIFYPKNSLKIFNRWGNIVYEKEPYLNEWKGECNTKFFANNNMLVTGTYYYILDLGEEQTPPYTGFVQIFK